MPPQNEILRENLQQLVVVTGRLEGSDLGGAMAKVQQTVAGLHLPASVRVEYGGTYEEQQKSFRDLLQVLLLALALVFGVLLAEFRNFPAPIAILTSSVLSISGVILALLDHRTPPSTWPRSWDSSWSSASWPRTASCCSTPTRRFRAEGASARDAMLHAAQRRLRPIVMTALAAVCGMLPLAFALGAGSQMLQPLAIAVIGGLTISMVLSLVVTPLVYFLLTRHREMLGRRIVSSRFSARSGRIDAMTADWTHLLLTAAEARVLGALMEKEVTTPGVLSALAQCAA